MKKIVAYILLSFMTVCIIAPTVQPAFAQTKQKEHGDIKYKIGNKEEQCRSKHPGKLLATIVPCIKDAVQAATEEMTDQFDEFLKGPTVAFMSLVVTLYGVKLLVREGDVKKDGLMLLFKMSGVFLFMDNFGGFIGATFGTIDDAVDMVTTSLGGLSGLQCPVDSYPGQKPWNFFDCILGEVFGFAPQLVVGSSLIGMLGAVSWSGQFGGMLFMGGVYVLFFLMRLIIRVTYTYLMAIIIVGFLIIISPLIIPLLLLNVTFSYFEHWLRALMSTMMQPVIVIAYVTLCFSILDKIMFDENVGLAKNLTKEDIEKGQNEKTSFNQRTVNNDPVSTIRAGGGDVKKIGSPTLVNYANPNFSGGTAPDAMFNEVSTWEVKDERAKKSQDIFVAMAALIIMAYLLNEMLDELIQLMQAVLGGGFALGQAVRNNPLEQKLEKMKKGAMQAFTGDKGGVEGLKNYVQGIARAPLSALTSR